MGWSRIGKGKFSGVTWSAPGRLHLCDPFLVWADRTDMPPKNLGQSKWVLDVLVELPNDNDKVVANLNWLIDHVEFKPRVPQSFHRPTKTRHWPRFFTGFLPAHRIEDLRAAMAKGTNIVRFALATSRQVDASDLGLDFTRKGRDAEKERVKKLFTVLSGPMSTEKPEGVSLYVIDDQCNWADPGLSPRVGTVWHQGRQRGPRGATGRQEPRPGDERWRDEAEVDARPIDALKPGPGDIPERYGQTLLEPCRTATELGEVEAYREGRYPHPLRQWSHGSVVMQVVAGRQRFPDCEPGAATARLEAPDANLHFVQLPDRTVLDTSGGSLAGFALDAMRRAARMAAHDRMEAVIVNLSYGTHSGPHDGTSMFERALLDMLAQYNGTDGRPKLHAVLPAGNSHLLRCHAGAWLARQKAPGSTHKLHWKILPDDPTDSFIEIWFSTPGRVAITIKPPGGDESPAVEPDSAFQWYDDSAKVLRAAVVYPDESAHGLHGTMALVAVGKTQRRADYGRYEQAIGGATVKAADLVPNSDRNKKIGQRVDLEGIAGVWTITLTNVSGDAVRFDAWVQRDDAAPARSRASHGYRGRQSYLLDPPDGAVTANYTLNGIATAEKPGQLWVVGAMQEDGRISSYSSAGPARNVPERVEGPDVVTVVDKSRNLPGLLAGGMLTASRVRVAGTSIAAAVFARMLFDLLHECGPDFSVDWARPCRHPLPMPDPAGAPIPAPDVCRGEWNRLKEAANLVKCKKPPAPR